jgi:hypothetical protein
VVRRDGRSPFRGHAIVSLGNAGLRVKATGILCNGGQSSIHNQ